MKSTTCGNFGDEMWKFNPAEAELHYHNAMEIFDLVDLYKENYT